jgi:hypothetical protein
MQSKAVVPIKNGGDEVWIIFNNLEFRSARHEVSPLLLGDGSARFRSLERDVIPHGDQRCLLGERFGSGDGERKTLLTRQIAFEPLPASVLFALGWCGVVHG